MNLDHLRYFMKLAEEQHYTKTAEKLCISQPSLSNAIKQLEKELGIRLFEKEGRRIRMTELSNQFYKCVAESLRTLDTGIETMRLAAKGNGVIRLGLLRVLGVDFLPELISEFQKTDTRHHYVFTMETDVSQNLLNGLEAGKYDMVFATPPKHPEAFDFLPVAKQDLVMIVPEDHPLSHHHNVDLRDTLDYPYVHFKKKSGMRSVIDTLYEKIDANPNIAYEIDEDQVVAGMVSAGFGIAIVPYMNLLHRLHVKILQISYPTWERNFYMITNKNRWLSPPVYSFHTFVQDKCQTLRSIT